MKWKRVPKNWKWADPDKVQEHVLCALLFSDEGEGQLAFGPLSFSNTPKGPGLFILTPEHRYYITIGDLADDLEASVDDW